MNTPPEEHHDAADTPFGDGDEPIVEPMDNYPTVDRQSLPPIADGPPRLAISTANPAVSIDLMKAQAEYLVALHNYIHDPDLTTLRQAQEAFINAQATYIHLADDRLLAEVQEQIIGIQLKALRKLGAV